MNDDWSAQILAIIIKRLGGSVTISRKELADIGDTQLVMDQNVIDNSFTFYVEDDTVIQGVVE